LNEALVDLVTNYSLVRFIPLSVKKKEMMLNVKNAIDQVNIQRADYFFKAIHLQDPFLGYRILLWVSRRKKCTKPHEFGILRYRL
jgi:hypothetical protein